MTVETTLPKFMHPMRVRFADTDLQGHVFFGNYYTYLDEAFMAYLRVLGFSWQQLGQMGLEIYYIDSGCQIRKPLYFEDVLHVHTCIAKLKNSSLTAAMTIVRENGELCASGFITGVMVDTASGQSTRIPDHFRAAVATYQDG